MNLETQAQEKRLELVLNDTVLAAPPESPEIPVECVAGGKKYIGKFTFRRPTIYTVAGIGARTAELQSVYNPRTGEWERRVPDVHYQVLAGRVATLESVVVKHPAWWDMENLADPEIVHAVYDAYQKWRDLFRSPVEEESPAPAAASAK